MTAEVTLQFRSPDELWAFRIEALIDFIRMNKDMNLLTCQCSPQQVQLAVAKYRASVVLNREADSNG